MTKRSALIGGAMRSGVLDQWQDVSVRIDKPELCAAFDINK